MKPETWTAAVLLCERLRENIEEEGQTQRVKYLSFKSMCTDWSSSLEINADWPLSKRWMKEKVSKKSNINAIKVLAKKKERLIQRTFIEEEESWEWEGLILEAGKDRFKEESTGMECRERIESNGDQETWKDVWEEWRWTRKEERLAILFSLFLFLLLFLWMSLNKVARFLSHSVSYLPLPSFLFNCINKSPSVDGTGMSVYYSTILSF